MEGKDSIFGSALESIIQDVEKQDAAEAKKKEKSKGPSGDPLKTGKPKELKGDGGDGKLKKLENKESPAKEGIEPDENKDDEGKKIEKLTEDVAEDVKSLIQKAKDALDGGNYMDAGGLCARLAEIQVAASEPESSKDDVIPEEPVVAEPVEPPMENKDEKGEEEDYTKFIMDDKLQEMIDVALDEGGEFKLDEAKGKDPKAKTRNRGDVVFPADSPKVTDDKDHFPINNQNQARNALARANQYKDSPKWYKGSLTDLVKKVATAVKKKYKDIEVTKAAKTPGKG